MTRTRRLLARESLAAALATALAALLVTCARPFNLGDEGYAYLLARTVARGESLYRSFEPIYPPGEFYWLGGWLALFGDHVLVFRAGAAALLGAAGALLWCALRPGSGRAVAAGALAAMAAIGLTQGAFKTLGMAVVALAAVVMARPVPPTGGALRGHRWLLLPAAAGFLLGWREDSAAQLGALSLLVALRDPRPLPRAGAALAAAGAGWVLWWPIAAARGELAPYLAHITSRAGFLVLRLGDPTPVSWSAPAAAPNDLRGLAYALLPLLVALPGLLYVAILLAAWRRRHRAGARRLAVAGALGLAYLPQFVWERPDVTHFRFHAPALITALALAAAVLPRGGRRAFALVLALPLLVVAGERLRGEPQRRTHPYPCCAGARAGVRLLEIPPWAGRLEGEGGRLIVLGWGPGYYLLEGEGPGTRSLSTFERHLGATGTARLVGDLLDPVNRWVIVAPGPIPRAVRQALKVHYERVVKSEGAALFRRRAP